MTTPKTHISLNVANVGRSVTFYEAFFGVPVHKRRPGYANFDVARPPLKLALNEAVPSEAGTSRLSHLGVQVGTRDEVEEARARLASVVTFDEGDTVCCYARQDKVWVTDPDGNSWEVYVLLDEMDEEDDAHFTPDGLAAEVRSACCSDDQQPSPRTSAGSALAMAPDTGDCCASGDARP